MTQTAERTPTGSPIFEQYAPTETFTELLQQLENLGKFPFYINFYERPAQISQPIENLIANLRLNLLAHIAEPRDTKNFHKFLILYTLLERIVSVRSEYQARFAYLSLELYQAYCNGEKEVTIPLHAFTITHFPDNLQNDTVAHSFGLELVEMLKRDPKLLFPGITVSTPRLVVGRLDQASKWSLQISIKEI